MLISCFFWWIYLLPEWKLVLMTVQRSLQRSLENILFSVFFQRKRCKMVIVACFLCSVLFNSKHVKLASKTICINLNIKYFIENIHGYTNESDRSFCHSYSKYNFGNFDRKCSVKLCIVLINMMIYFIWNIYLNILLNFLTSVLYNLY